MVFCDSKFIIEDENENAVEGARATVKETGQYAITDRLGKCTITGLEKGNTYHITPSKKGYEDGKTDSFYACTINIRIVIALGKYKNQCTQIFSVLEEGATVIVDIPESGSSLLCTTDENGNCSIELGEGIIRLAHAEHPDYLPSDSVFFTSCNPLGVFLRLKPKPEETEAVGAQQIVTKNAEAMAEAVVIRYDGLTLPGFSDPPHICPICGESFNNTGEFMGHIGDHISAYEEQNKQWL